MPRWDGVAVTYGGCHAHKDLIQKDDRSDLEFYDERFKFDDPASEFDLFVPIT